MATIEIRFPHGTTLEDASRRTRLLMHQFVAERAEMVKELRWPEGSAAGSLDGRGFDGKFSVTASDVRLDVDLSLLTRPFKAKVESRLLEKLAAEFKR